MASNDNSWIADTVGDFIHSPVWIAPVHTFIETHCAAFDYDDDEKDESDIPLSVASSVEEQMNIHERYQHLVDLLIEGLGQDLDLDGNELKRVCQLPTTIDDSVVIDESYEQLYSARDFQLFQEMMRRKNLILQLQALVSLQLQWGLLNQSDTGDDLVLSLLLQATSTSSRRGSTNPLSIPIERPVEKPPLHEKEYKSDDDDDDDVVVVQQKQQSPPPSSSSKKKKERIVPQKPAKKEYQLPGLRHKGGADLDADWYRKLRAENKKEDDDEDLSEDDQSNQTSTPQTINAVPEQLLREKLRELTVRTTASVDDKTAEAINARKNFLQQQRDAILKKKRTEREQDLDQEPRTARPQSAIHVARKAMATTNKPDEKKQQQEQQTQIPNDELIRRRAMADRLKREVVDKR